MLGASGIGRFHVRELARAGAELVAILGSSEASARRTAERLGQEYGVRPAAHHELRSILELELDAISVCTPSELHLEALTAALDAGCFVLAEKPLFWQPGLTLEQTRAHLAELERLGAAQRLALNVGNDLFLEQALLAQGPAPQPSRFDFRFHTQGPHRAAAIAVDLLPHALSLLLRLAPEGEPREVCWELGENALDCRFEWGPLHCHFDLREDPQGPKELSFALDGKRWQRRQLEAAGRYQVHLEAADGVLSPALPDPLGVVVQDFVRGAETGASFRTGFERASRLQLLMLQLLTSLECESDAACPTGASRRPGPRPAGRSPRSPRS